jgi:hypothetical protein
MFSLKSLLFIVAVAALGAAGLIYRTQLWASALVALTLGVLVQAVCRAWFVRAGRTFWGPFALVGALYLVIVSYQPLQELHYNLPTTQVVVYALEKMQTPMTVPVPATSAYYAPSAPVYAPAMPNAVSPGPPVTSGYSSGYGSNAPVYVAPAVPTAMSIVYTRSGLFRTATSYVSESDGFPAQARAFLWAAQCLWCLLLAFVMGMTCDWLFRPANRESANPSGG